MTKSKITDTDMLNAMIENCWCVINPCKTSISFDGFDSFFVVVDRCGDWVSKEMKTARGAIKSAMKLNKN